MHLNQGMSLACHQQNDQQATDKARIVVIEDSFPVISETFVLDQISGLIDRGLDVENWSLRRLDQGVSHSKVIQYRLIEKTRYLALPTPELRHTPQAWVNELTRLNGLGDLSRIGAFHIHFGTNFITFEPLFQVLDTFLIVSFYGYDASKYLVEHGDRCYDALFRRADLITTPTKYMMDELVRKGCPADKITVHRCGVAIPALPLSRAACGNRVTMLSVARLVEKKGIEYALRAFALIAVSNDVKYRIIGDGPLKYELMELAKQLGLAGVVEFIGFIPIETLLHEMEQADIIVLPSVTADNGDQEGLPVTLVTAQALGLPVISTFHAGIPELVIDGVTGFLSIERDVQQIAQHMERLTNDPGLRQSFGAKGRERVQDEFDIET
ncbi:MAG: glycosyltransferase, partial [Geobacter sp.]